MSSPSGAAASPRSWSQQESPPWRSVRSDQALGVHQITIRMTTATVLFCVLLSGCTRTTVAGAPSAPHTTLNPTPPPPAPVPARHPPPPPAAALPPRPPPGLPHPPLH